MGVVAAYVENPRCSLCRSEELPTWTWFSCFTFQNVLCYFLQREERRLESTLIKTLSVHLPLCPNSMSLHPPTPIPVLRLRKQVNQTQKPVGCETSPGPSEPSIISFGLWRKTKQTRTKITPNSSELVSLLNSAPQSWQQHRRQPYRPDSRNKLTLLETELDSGNQMPSHHRQQDSRSNMSCHV